MSRFAFGDFTVATATSPLIPESPFQEYGDNVQYVFRQNYWQFLENFAPLPLGTQHTNGAYLVEESTPRNLGHGVIEWQRTWAHVPNRQVEPGRTVHTFVSSGGPTIGKISITKKVASEVFWDFFYAPGNEFRKIPLYSAEKQQIRSGTLVTASALAFNLDGVAIPEGYDKPLPLTNSAGKTVKTVIEDSTLERWMGDIWVRKTATVRTRTFTGSNIAIS